MNDIPDIIQGVEQKLFVKAINKRLPIYGNLELTPLCNMNCDMCFVRLSPHEMSSKGHLRTVAEYIRLVDEMREAGVLFIQLTGGEPLTYPGFRDIYLHLIESGIVVTVNTNGTLLDDDWADFFASHPPRRINITLYGSDNEAYQTLCHHPHGFDLTLAAIKRLKRRGVMVKLNHSVTQKNRDQLDEIIRVASSLDVPVKVDTYMYPCIRERSRPYNRDVRLRAEEMVKIDEGLNKRVFIPESYKELCRNRLAKLDEWTRKEVDGKTAHPMHFNCNAGRCVFIVNWQGMLRPCIMLDTPSVDVFATGFVEGWNIISESAKKVTFSPACSVCKLLPICKVCAASAILETGNNHDAPQYLCQSAQALHNILQQSANGEG
ncbi:MAG: radical SAM protein [Bacteroidaceae bacterium]|nr:radical SAM protein [Bacteroidaceae bacterium]